MLYSNLFFNSNSIFLICAREHFTCDAAGIDNAKRLLKKQFQIVQ